MFEVPGSAYQHSIKKNKDSPWSPFSLHWPLPTPRSSFEVRPVRGSVRLFPTKTEENFFLISESNDGL